MERLSAVAEEQVADSMSLYHSPTCLSPRGQLWTSQKGFVDHDGCDSRWRSVLGRPWRKDHATAWPTGDAHRPLRHQLPMSIHTSSASTEGDVQTTRRACARTSVGQRASRREEERYAWPLGVVTRESQSCPALDWLLRTSVPSSGVLPSLTRHMAQPPHHEGSFMR